MDPKGSVRMRLKCVDLLSVPSNAPSSGLPFVIYDETQAKKQPESAPFKIFEDQENKCPPNTVRPPKRKSLSGILQPSLEVQSDPTQEKDCIVMEEPQAEVRYGNQDGVTTKPVFRVSDQV